MTEDLGESFNETSPAKSYDAVSGALAPAQLSYLPSPIKLHDRGWPGTATRALGLIVGVSLITSGAAITMVALAGRSLVKTIAGARA